MSLPFSKFIPISTKIQKPSFTASKKHLIFASTSKLIPSESPFLEFEDILEVQKYFGKNSIEFHVAQKYFNFSSKGGNTPDKLIIARFYKESSPAFIKSNTPLSLKEIKEKDNFEFSFTINGNKKNLKFSLSSVSSYKEIAQILKLGFDKISTPDFKEASVEYSDSLNCFFIESGIKGTNSEISIEGENLELLGLKDAVFSKGVNAESFSSFVQRITLANSSGFSITSVLPLSDEDIKSSIEYIQGNIYGQSINTLVRLVFNFNDKLRAIKLQEELKQKNYTGYVFCYDPYNEFVNILSCAIAASIDFTSANSAVNFNFQKAKGFTPITTLGDVSSFQQGKTNLSICSELDKAKINYVYSVGVGFSKEVLYGMGLVNGDFATEDIQVNESALQSALAVKIMNGFISQNKIPLRNSDGIISTLITPVFEQFKLNGVIAVSGTLSETDKQTVSSLVSIDAVSAIEQNGYFYKIHTLTDEDVKLRRVRITVCYIASGVVNTIRISNNIFGA